jgi:hypothetical protein
MIGDQSGRQNLEVDQKPALDRKNGFGLCSLGLPQLSKMTIRYGMSSHFAQEKYNE